MSDYAPITRFGLSGLADQVRASRKRIPGFCRQIFNSAPNRTDGETIRQGYAAYSAIAPPAGMENLQVVPIQKPSQEDVHFWFCNPAGTPYVYMNPWWAYNSNPATAKRTTNFSLPSTDFLVIPAGMTFPSANTMRIATAGLGLTLTANFYAGRLGYNINAGAGRKYAQVKSWTDAGGGNWDLTFVEDVNAGGFNWAIGNLLYLSSNFHDNTTFGLSYNNSLTAPPIVRSDDSIIRLSGGLSATTGNRGIHITPYMSRTFFPNVAGRSFSYYGTYISEAECKAFDCLNDVQSIQSGSQATNPLIPSGETVYLAVAPIYDGFQIGKPTVYPGMLTDGTTNGAAFYIAVNLGSLNKRMTGIAIFAAVDTVDTRSTKRMNQLKYVQSHSFIDTAETGWTFTVSTGKFVKLNRVILSTELYGATTPFVNGAGYIEASPDTSYSYSDRTVIDGIHVLTNAYVASEALADRENVFTSPLGGIAGINAGLNQPDIFSNEPGGYRQLPLATSGRKITGLHVFGIGEVLLLRDRGILYGRPEIGEDFTLNFNWEIISRQAGCATLRGATDSKESEEGGIRTLYFNGYDDVYSYSSGVLKALIERTDRQDWLYTYRELITKAQKESTLCFYLPQGIVKFDFGQVDGNQYSFYPYRKSETDNGWRQDSYNVAAGVTSRSFWKYATGLQDGTALTLEVNSGGTTQGIRQWQNAGALYFSDNGTAVRRRYDTGDIWFDMIYPGKDFLYDRAVILRSFDVLGGTLDVVAYREGQATVWKNFLALNKQERRLILPAFSTDGRLMRSLRIIDNANDATPEYVSSGSILQIDGIELYGELRATLARSGIAVSAAGAPGVVPDGDVSGLKEILLYRAAQVYGFDHGFQNSYVGIEGTVVSWRMLVESAHPFSGSEDRTVNNMIFLSQKRLAEMTAFSDSDLVLVKYKIIEGGTEGLISSKAEVTLNKTPQTFTWDTPFLNTYTGVEGASIPAYRIMPESAHPIAGGVQDTTVDNGVFITAKTLNGFTAKADSDNVLFKFRAEEVGSTGLIAGLNEVTVNKAPTTFTWDAPFVNSYVGLEGISIPAYRIIVESAHPVAAGVQDTNVNAQVFISDKTLTGFTMYSDSDSVLVKFKVIE